MASIHYHFAIQFNTFVSCFQTFSVFFVNVITVYRFGYNFPQ